MNNMSFALNLLLAGIVIVFFVLILLILVIKIFGMIVQSAQNKGKKRKEAQNTKKATQEKETEQLKSTAPTSKTTDTANGSVPGEIVAVIAAAVDSIYGEQPVKIKSIKRSRNSGSAWRNAGLLENTKPF